MMMGPNGSQTIVGDQTLFLNFGNEVRALEFLAQRQAQGHASTTIKTFQVPQSFLDKIAAEAVPEFMAREYPNAPIRVDTTKAANQFGLRKPQIDALRKVTDGE